MLRDVWFRDSEAAVSGDSTRSQWVHLFLNGQYWGLYMLKEQVSALGAAQAWGGSAADYDVIKVADDFGYEVRDGDDDQWLQVWGIIVDGVLTDDEYAQVEQLVNLDSLIDYWLLNVATGNKDGTPTIYRATSGATTGSPSAAPRIRSSSSWTTANCSWAATTTTRQSTALAHSQSATPTPSGSRTTSTQGGSTTSC